jgi:hypothetical protein
MTLLLDASAISARRQVATGPLAPLAESLIGDLERAMSLPLVIPPKARLTRRGGRCQVDASLLAFDPSAPHEHRCPSCGRYYRGEEHDQWWAMGQQLWLAERTVHAATLHALRGMPHAAAWAADALLQLSEAYLRYPNRDNVLGPSRPFFSTYLESLWLLHICIATDILESAGQGGAWSSSVRDLLVEPSAALISSFNEGSSNRQVWNSSALVAANALLGRQGSAMRWAEGKFGTLHHLEHGFLRDGTWYEGENYHQFAQRGLWYGFTLYESLGGELGLELDERWHLATMAPFASALPDLTLPARKDSQWRTSLRQWRFAEQAELGLARWPDDAAIAAVLHELYSKELEHGNTGRAISTGEAERNSPASGLARADLGWKSLLFALAELPADHGRSEAGILSRSVLQRDQGYAVIRRSGGRVYAALDYGSGGGGHGHPDHLNLVLQQGAVRWFDDPGTGSYTDPSLHWYRSSMAHHVPIVNGQTQRHVAAKLLAYHDGAEVSLVAARADGIAPGVRVRRVLCVMPGYLIDDVEWSGEDAKFLDLPVHLSLEVESVREWSDLAPEPAGQSDPGYSWLEGAQSARPGASVCRVRARKGEAWLDGWLLAGTDAILWHAKAPSAPGEVERTRNITVVRVPHAAGRITTVWSWDGSVADVELLRSRGSGTYGLRVGTSHGSTHEHLIERDGWTVSVPEGPVSAVSIPMDDPDHSEQVRQSCEDDTMSGRAGGEERTGQSEWAATEPAPVVYRIPRLPVDSWSFSGRSLSTAAAAFDLGEAHWRGTEQSWEEAGSPSARVRIAALAESFALEVDMRKITPVFADAREENPLDNEHPDVNSDGVQLHIARGGRADDLLVWLLVPEPGGSSVRISPRTSGAGAVDIVVRWWETSTGWALRADVPLREVAFGSPEVVLLDVLINEISAERERRRGQLVLSGARGENAWLRGDRQDVQRFLKLEIHG